MTDDIVHDASSVLSCLTIGLSPVASSSSDFGLDGLNDHVLLAIISFIDTANTVSALSRTCRRLYTFIQNDGWRAFVKTSFGNLTIPHGIGQPWSKVADSLSWQTRCWDRRSIVLSQTDPNRPSTRQGRQTVRFRPILAAHLDHKDGVELVVCGAGENIEGRFRGRFEGPTREIGISWHHLPGIAHGYVAGRDDVTALALMEHQEKGLCMVAGRAQGNLHVMLATRDHTFGQKLCRLESPNGNQRLGVRSSEATLQANMRNRNAEIKSVDVSKEDHFIIANTAKDVLLYRYKPEEGLSVDGDGVLPSTKPLCVKNLVDDGSLIVEKSSNYPLTAVKFIGNNLIGVAKSGGLHYLNITPTGLEGAATKSNAAHCKQLRDESTTHTIYAIEPVTSHSLAGGGFNLMLSSWLGGNIKLQDLRTPTPYDYVYRDSFNPYTASMSLASYGSSHFLAGNEEGWLKVFDYRMPRPYHHVNAIPCSTRKPFPSPMANAAPLLKKRKYCFPCNHLEGKKCRWHSQSQALYYRPNFSLGVAKLAGRQNRTIWSLAKASDISPTFYFGLSGTVLEGNLFTYSDSTTDNDGRPARGGQGDPLFGFWKPPPPGKKAKPTGDGTVFMESWDHSMYGRHIRSGGTMNVEWVGSLKACPPVGKSPFGNLARWHRFDDKYHTELDYRRSITQSNFTPCPRC